VTKKILLGVAALAVVAMIVGLLVSVRSVESTASTRQPVPSAPAPAPPPPGASEPRVVPSADTPAAPPPGAPAPPAGAVVGSQPPRPPAADDPAGPPEVRDHRGGGPTAPPSPLKPATVAAVRQALEPQLRACADGLASDSPRPLRFVAHSTLRSGSARVTSHGLRLTGAEALGPQFADCVGRAYATLSSDVGEDQADGEDMVHMPWTIP
jgi:hypothetical protein